MRVVILQVTVTEWVSDEGLLDSLNLPDDLLDAKVLSSISLPDPPEKPLPNVTAPKYEPEF